MKKTIYIALAVLLLLVVLLSLVLTCDRPRPPQPTGNPVVLTPRPPALPHPSEIVIADTTGILETVAIDEADEVAVTVTVEADTTGDPVQLIVDRPEAEWFPELDLVRTDIRIRTLDPAQAPLVTVVKQRMSVFALETEPFAGAGYGKDVEAVGGVVLLRIWVLHFGPSISYNHDEGFVFDGAVAVEVRPRLLLGGRIKERRVFLAYRF